MRVFARVSQLMPWSHQSNQSMNAFLSVAHAIRTR
eukprot:COSAG02_NODE_58429_length_277_cov_0.870787_1_plen_34_part_10